MVYWALDPQVLQTADAVIVKTGLRKEERGEAMRLFAFVCPRPERHLVVDAPHPYHRP